MSNSKWLTGLAAAVALIGLGTGYIATTRAHEAEANTAVLSHRTTAINAQLAELEQRAMAEGQRVQRAEDENTRLLKEVRQEQAGVAAPAPLPERVTSDVVAARMTHGRELMKSGDYASALTEFLWCFDTGYKETRMSAVRLSFGVAAIAELADRYPPARQALVERREQARRAMLADEGDLDAASEFSALVRELKEGASIVPILEALPTGDRRRARLAEAARDVLVERQSYDLAAEAVMYAFVSSNLETIDRRPATRNLVIQRTADDIEILAGAGRLDEARNLVQRVLALDPSADTRELLQRHLERAGHPALLSSPAK